MDLEEGLHLLPLQNLFKKNKNTNRLSLAMPASFAYALSLMRCCSISEKETGALKLHHLFVANKQEGKIFIEMNRPFSFAFGMKKKRNTEI